MSAARAPNTTMVAITNVQVGQYVFAAGGLRFYVEHRGIRKDSDGRPWLKLDVIYPDGAMGVRRYKGNWMQTLVHAHNADEMTRGMGWKLPEKL